MNYYDHVVFYDDTHQLKITSYEFLKYHCGHIIWDNVNKNSTNKILCSDALYSCIMKKNINRASYYK